MSASTVTSDDSSTAPHAASRTYAPGDTRAASSQSRASSSGIVGGAAAHRAWRNIQPVVVDAISYLDDTAKRHQIDLVELQTQLGEVVREVAALKEFVLRVEDRLEATTSATRDGRSSSAAAGTVTLDAVKALVERQVAKELRKAHSTHIEEELRRQLDTRAAGGLGAASPTPPSGAVSASAHAAVAADAAEAVRGVAALRKDFQQLDARVEETDDRLAGAEDETARIGAACEGELQAAKDHCQRLDVRLAALERTGGVSGAANVAAARLAETDASVHGAVQSRVNAVEERLVTLHQTMQSLHQRFETETRRAAVPGGFDDDGNEVGSDDGNGPMTGGTAAPHTEAPGGRGRSPQRHAELVPACTTCREDAVFGEPRRRRRRSVSPPAQQYVPSVPTAVAAPARSCAQFVLRPRHDKRGARSAAFPDALHIRATDAALGVPVPWARQAVGASDPAFGWSAPHRSVVTVRKAAVYRVTCAVFLRSCGVAAARGTGPRARRHEDVALTVMLNDQPCLMPTTTRRYVLPPPPPIAVAAEDAACELAHRRPFCYVGMSDGQVEEDEAQRKAAAGSHNATAQRRGRGASPQRQAASPQPSRVSRNAFATPREASDATLASHSLTSVSLTELVWLPAGTQIKVLVHGVTDWAEIGVAALDVLQYIAA